jgi:hypothetical protein
MIRPGTVESGKMTKDLEAEMKSWGAAAEA